MRKTITLLFAFTLLACSYYPKQVEYYDRECDIVYKRLILKSSFNDLSAHCSNEACILELLSIPVQAVVAGSVIVAGNAVYWLQKEGSCILKV